LNFGNYWEITGFECERLSLREGFLIQRSNLTTIANSERIKIASYLAMTTLFIEIRKDSSLRSG